MSSRGNVSLVARVRSQYVELPGEPRHSPLRMEALVQKITEISWGSRVGFLP